ncbi:MAG: hypothetical protein KF813_14065 [Trueperaceae bacterium]|nr:hypothetical protein [Trueperaceae bacterium]
MQDGRGQSLQDGLFGTRDPLDEMRSALEATGRFKVLERLAKPATYSPEVPVPARASTCIYLDVETTGLRSSEDKIIQLGIVAFRYDAFGNVHDVVAELDEFEDPGRPIPEEITELTGITDEDVRGTRIDDERVAALLADASLVVAHNASFDRPFVEKRFPAFKDVTWACSIEDVNWRSEGFGSSKLEWLAFQHGFFYDSHRASSDCLAGVRLLAAELPRSQRTAMSKLLESAARHDVRLWAVGSPFETKDALRRRGYRWQASAKVWWRDLRADQHEAELEWLTKNVYGGRRRELPFVSFDGALRYSSRISDDPASARG